MTEKNDLQRVLGLTYSNRSNAGRAAKKAGLATSDFRIDPVGPESFRVVLTREQPTADPVAEPAPLSAEDATDVVVAEDRLAEIEADPSVVVRGEALDRALVDDGFPHDDTVEDRVTLGDPEGYAAHMEGDYQDDTGDGLPETEPMLLVTAPLEERDPEFAAQVEAERREVAAERASESEPLPEAVDAAIRTADESREMAERQAAEREAFQADVAARVAAREPCAGAELLAEIPCECGAQDGDPCGRGVVLPLAPVAEASREQVLEVLGLPADESDPPSEADILRSASAAMDAALVSRAADAGLALVPFGGPATGVGEAVAPTFRQAFGEAGGSLAAEVDRMEFLPVAVSDEELVAAARDQAVIFDGSGNPKVAHVLRLLADRIDGGRKPAKAAPAAGVRRGVRDRSDPLEKPVISSPTNQTVARLCDRLEAARGDLAALESFAFRPSSTYYTRAHRYWQALLAEARGKSEAA
jgi:hypothetical protein